jgi:hypothetical protein
MSEKLALSQKGDEKTQGKVQKEIEIELKKEEAHTYLICWCVWLRIDLKEQQKESTTSWGKTTRDFRARPSSTKQQRAQEIQGKQLHSRTREEKKARKQKLANTKIHTYVKEPKRAIRKRE